MKSNTGKAAMPRRASPSDDFMDKVPEGAREDYSEEFTRNGWITLLIVALAVAAGAIWAVLFWQAESFKMQLLWGLLLLGELVGIGILVLIHLATENRLILQREHRLIELQINDLQERLAITEHGTGKE